MRKKTNPIDAARLKYEAALKASTRKPAPKGRKRVAAKKTVKRVVRRANPVEKQVINPKYFAELNTHYENLISNVGPRLPADVRQATLSTAHGMVVAGRHLGALTATEYSEWTKKLLAVR